MWSGCHGPWSYAYQGHGERQRLLHHGAGCGGDADRPPPGHFQQPDSRAYLQLRKRYRQYGEINVVHWADVPTLCLR